MNISWNTIGHKLPKEYLNNAIVSNKLSQAYLFVGPEGVGKTSLALDLSAFLLKKVGKAKLNESDSDFILIDQTEEIKISQIRAVKQKLSFRSMTGGKKIAVVTGAEKMNKESANAFLKALEEPSGDVVFILTTSVPGKLPATVLSRTQKLYFFRNSDKELEEFLDSKGVSGKSKKQILELSFGRIGFAYRLLEDKELMRECLEWKKEFAKALEGNTGENLIFSSVLAKNETVKLNEILNFWLMLADDHLTQSVPNQNFKFKEFFLAIETSLQDLERNLNKKLILDNLFLQINPYEQT